MKLTIPVVISIFVLLILAMDGCRKKSAAPVQTPMPVVIPAGFPADITVFNNNPVTKEGFELGRKLFYDGRLSIDGNYPCSSCHQQEAAFGLYDHDLAHGYNNQHTTRNAPPLINLAWQKAFHLDGGFTSLEEVAAYHITASNEMAEKMENVVNKLKGEAV